MKASIQLLRSTISALKKQRDTKPPGYYTDPEIRMICDVAEEQLNAEISEHEEAIKILENHK